jgi:hypothetical protein
MVLADEYYGYATTNNPSLVKPPAAANMLLLTEVGIGPKKVNGGKYGEYLKFTPGSRDTSAGTVFEIEYAGKPVSVNGVEATSVSFQAETRGGKPFQAILDGKAEFKDTTAAVGTAATNVGAGLLVAGALSGNNNLMYAGAGSALLGLLSTAASEAAKPSADTRYWDMLPHAIDVGATTVGGQDLKDLKALAALTDASGNRVGNPIAMLTAKKGKCGMAWGREIAASGTASAPNSSYAGSLAKTMLQKDATFRSQLLSDSAPTQQ